MSNFGINDLYPRIRGIDSMFDDYSNYRRMVMGEWPNNILSQDTHIGGLTKPYKGGEESEYEDERLRRIL